MSEPLTELGTCIRYWPGHDVPHRRDGKCFGWKPTEDWQARALAAEAKHTALLEVVAGDDGPHICGRSEDDLDGVNICRDCVVAALRENRESDDGT